MPYAYIHYIKLQIEILDDKRFIFDCNESQKWLFIGLLLLAGTTKNSIPNDENYLKNRLNLSENSQKIRENLDLIISTFPKISCKNGYIKFKNFSKLHNILGNSEGNPKDSQRENNSHARLDKVRLDKIIHTLIEKKGWDKDNKIVVGSTYKRYAKSAKELLLLVENDDYAVRAVKWVGDMCKGKGLNWTLETVIKWLPDFMAKYPIPDNTPKEVNSLLANIGNIPLNRTKQPLGQTNEVKNESSDR